MAATLGGIEWHDLNRGEVDVLFSRIDAVTLEKANAVARQYLQESNLQFCLFKCPGILEARPARFGSDWRSNG
ncbi:MAG: hypothetical protein JJE04_05260 [Acidobacteriia bacterium]|nr:hypothetical protein [Terriglobia bacterium]